MRRFATVTGGFVAVVLLTAAAATARQTYDPMAALIEAPPYDALHSTGVAHREDAAIAGSLPSAALRDPMAAAGQPQGPATGATAAALGAPDPELGDLPDGLGAEETYYQCVACHSTAIIRQQRVTDARWDYLWHWMVEQQGMVEPDEETREVILGYLKQHFSSER